MKKLLRVSLSCSLLLSAAGLGVIGCNTAATNTQDQQQLTSDAQKAVSQMERMPPGFRPS